MRRVELSFFLLRKEAGRWNAGSVGVTRYGEAGESLRKQREATSLPVLCIVNGLVTKLYSIMRLVVYTSTVMSIT